MHDQETFKPNEATYTITFDGKDYLAMELPNGYKVAETALQDTLFAPDGDPVNDEADAIDSELGYFVDREHFAKTPEDLMYYVIDAIDEDMPIFNPEGVQNRELDDLRAMQIVTQLLEDGKIYKSDISDAFDDMTDEDVNRFVYRLKEYISEAQS